MALSIKKDTKKKEQTQHKIAVGGSKGLQGDEKDEERSRWLFDVATEAMRIALLRWGGARRISLRGGVLHPSISDSTLQT